LRATVNKIGKRYFGQKDLELNYRKVRGAHEKVFYYDAIPAAKDGESDAQYRTRVEPRKKLHDKIASQERYHVYEGDSRVRRKEIQQKKVDIMIAVDMLTHTVRGNMNQCTLIASDLDFKPLVDALVQEGMFVRLMYPPLDTAVELYSSADERIPLTIRSVYPWLENSLQAQMRPPSWSLESKVDFEGGDQLAQLDHPHLGQVRLFKKGDAYSAVWDDLEWVGSYLRVSNPDYGILRNALKEHYLLDIPEKL